MHEEHKFEPSHTDLDFTKYDKPYEIRRTKILAGMIPEGNDDLALDVGCGPGYFSKMLVEKGWRSTAIDTSPANIDSAQEYASSTHLGDAITVLSGLPEDNFGLAVAFEIIEHMPRTMGEDLLRRFGELSDPTAVCLFQLPIDIPWKGWEGITGVKK